MSELSSYKIQLNQHIHTQDIVKINHYAVKNDVKMYLYRDHLIADAKKLPKILSFFLLCRKDQSLVLIIDGEDAKEVYQTITQLLDKTINTEIRKENIMETDKSILI
ncbi:HPr family phosphocarrier protein [Oceanobacillus manasiensis]|uniref:HPr family phosphocarrier protein n=1 Tax=Oceanobacillus manasiensis TaxID=586413 RepID=UPI0005AACDA9|nr:HPr family phosphocarrier protein [Oceanobacillus manasiensis]